MTFLFVKLVSFNSHKYCCGPAVYQFCLAKLGGQHSGLVLNFTEKEYIYFFAKNVFHLVSDFIMLTLAT